MKTQGAGERIYQFEIEKADEGQRLDRYLALAVPALSRSAIQRLIRDGDVSVDELTAPKHRVQTGERVSLRIPPPRAAAPEAQPMDLDFLYRDEHFVVINKPAGMTVHPAPGQADQTLVNGLLYEGGTVRNRRCSTAWYRSSIGSGDKWRYGRRLPRRSPSKTVESLCAKRGEEDLFVRHCGQASKA